MTIQEWIREATTELVGVGVGTAKLDAELILSHTLRQNRTWIHMYHDEELSDRYREIADARLLLRLDRIPLAYIIGHKEFYGRRFDVTPATLIPRPESEAIIDMLKEFLPATKSLRENTKRLVDVGTGSGCLGITAKLEFPKLDVTLSDISKHALNVAEKNAQRLEANVRIFRGDLLENYHLKSDIIIANLPYVDMSWEHSPEIEHEPAEALYADEGGLLIIKRLIPQAARILPKGGLLILEADPEQHSAIEQYAKQYNLRSYKTHGYAVCLMKD